MVNLRYYCVYCADAGIGIAYNDKRSVQNHWFNKHRCYEFVKPFRFYAVEIAKCYQCSYSGSWKDLIKHYEEMHPQEEFAILKAENRAQCAICSFDGECMRMHFKVHHRTLTLSPIFNPLPMKIARSIDYKASPIVSFTCCNKDIDKNDLFDHKLHHKDVACPICGDFASNDMFDVLSHAHETHKNFDLIKTIAKFKRSVLANLFETKVTFGSGLTLFCCNLVKTKIDPSHRFQRDVKDWSKILAREFHLKYP